LARALAQRGWRLILDARGADALEAVRAELAALTTVITLPGDVTDPDHRAQLLAAAEGRVDVVINNAGALGQTPRPALLDHDLDDFEAVLRANVAGPLGVIQALRPALRANARILNITSDASVEPYAGWGAYGASKAALDHLSAILAAEQPEWRVYAIDPGDMRTQMHQDAFPGEDISDRPLPEESVPALLALIDGDRPSGRFKARELLTPSGMTPSGMTPSAATPAGVEGLRVVLRVMDVEEAKQLYGRGLALRQLAEWKSPGSHGVLYEAGAATLEVVDAGHASEVDVIEVGRPVVGQVRLAFTVPDVAQATDVLAGQAEPLGGATLTPWNHRNQRLVVSQHPEVQLTLSQVEGEEVLA
jgi:NAD(P)-dependent dehydrogenase (short-subunit alcohol dehydrogenase family)/catechol 2,3-dioxygenase-like lactoylglutathione lyase family enzyme